MTDKQEPEAKTDSEVSKEEVHARARVMAHALFNKDKVLPKKG